MKTIIVLAASVLMGCAGVVAQPSSPPVQVAAVDTAQVQAQTAQNIRCYQGDVESCDPATRDLMQRQADDRAKMLEQASRQAKCAQGDIESCDPATRARLEQQKALEEQRRQEQEQQQAQERAEAEARNARMQTTEWQACAQEAIKLQAQKDIAAERSNPGGVWDKGVLHSAGQDIQSADANLVVLKRRFLQEKGRSFTLKDCEGVYP